jgi:hypothetical protein
MVFLYLHRVANGFEPVPTRSGDFLQALGHAVVSAVLAPVLVALGKGVIRQGGERGGGVLRRGEGKTRPYTKEGREDYE